MEALRLKDEMINCGKPMNLVVAKALMKGYFSQGNPDSALNLFFNYHYSYYLGVEGLAKKKKVRVLVLGFMGCLKIGCGSRIGG